MAGLEPKCSALEACGRFRCPGKYVTTEEKKLIVFHSEQREEGDFKLKPLFSRL